MNPSSRGEWSPEDMVSVFFKFSRVLGKMKRSDGVSIPEMMIFRIISEHEETAPKEEAAVREITVGEIAKKMDITKSAVSQSINKLEENGLIERYMKRDDRRITYVRLTDRGRERRRKNFSEAVRLLDRVEGVMGVGDMQTLTKLLEKFYQTMSETENAQGTGEKTQE